MKEATFLNNIKDSKLFDNGALLLLRLTLAVVIFPHGAQLLLGWFGGFGYTETMKYFTAVANLPYLIGMLVIGIQFFGALMLLLGIAVRLNALAMFTIFIGMIVTSHLEHGFFMNWYGSQKGEGYEYHLLVLGMTLALMLKGGGRYAIAKTENKV